MNRCFIENISLFIVKSHLVCENRSCCAQISLFEDKLLFMRGLGGGIHCSSYVRYRVRPFRPKIMQLFLILVVGL